MVVIFGASHVNVWVAFIGFFLPLVVAFASRNAACLAFLETQDCIGHNSSSFLRRVICMRDGHDDDDGDFGIPPHKSRNRHADILLSEAESVG